MNADPGQYCQHRSQISAESCTILGSDEAYLGEVLKVVASCIPAEFPVGQRPENISLWSMTVPANLYGV